MERGRNPGNGEVAVGRVAPGLIPSASDAARARLADDDFRYFREEYEKSVEAMFAAVGELYARYWNDFFHFAAFDDEATGWEEAFAETHAAYVRALKVDRAGKVLELACGRGAFAEILADNTPGDVLGIDLSPAQLARARKRRRPNLRFRRHDVMRVDELGDTFDAVAFLDAACYLPDKRVAIERIARVVAPGGRFLLVDWCKREGLSALQEELVLHPFMHAWAIPDLETRESYARNLQRSGLRVLESVDLSARVRRNWEHGYAQALKALEELSPRDAPRLLWKRARLGAEGVRLLKNQFAAALYTKAGYDAGFLRYAYFLAEKPRAVARAEVRRADRRARGREARGREA